MSEGIIFSGNGVCVADSKGRFAPETVDAGVRVAKLGTSSVRYEIGLFKLGEDEAVAEGHFVHVYVDSTDRRPAPLPQDLRTFLTTLVRDAA